jgi:hypothetical protein
MKNDQRERRIEAALAELKQLIKGRYPEARFSVAGGPEDPQEVHLVATMDRRTPMRSSTWSWNACSSSSLRRSFRCTSVLVGHHNGGKPCGPRSGRGRPCYHLSDNDEARRADPIACWPTRPKANKAIRAYLTR